MISSLEDVDIRVISNETSRLRFFRASEPKIVFCLQTT